MHAVQLENVTRKIQTYSSSEVFAVLRESHVSDRLTISVVKRLRRAVFQGQRVDQAHHSIEKSNCCQHTQTSVCCTYMITYKNIVSRTQTSACSWCYKSPVFHSQPRCSWMPVTSQYTTNDGLYFVNCCWPIAQIWQWANHNWTVVFNKNSHRILHCLEIFTIRN